MNTIILTLPGWYHPDEDVQQEKNLTTDLFSEVLVSTTAWWGRLVIELNNSEGVGRRAGILKA